MEGLEKFVKVSELGLHVASHRLCDKDGKEIAGVPSHLDKMLAERDLEMHSFKILTPNKHLRMLTPKEMETLLTLQKEYPQLHETILRGYETGETSGELVKDENGDYWEFYEGENLDYKVLPSGETTTLGLWEALTSYAGVRGAYQI